MSKSGLLGKNLRSGIMSRAKRALVAAVFGAALSVFAATTADASIIKPSTSHQVSVALNAKGDPIPFILEVSGYSPGEPVYIEVCDGEPETTTGWSPSTDCDETTSGAAVQANAKGDATFPVGSQSEVLLFRGASPEDQFNCLAPADIAKGASPKPGMGDVVPRAKAVYPSARTVAYDSNQPGPHAPDPTVTSWDNCQLRISSTNETATSDQQFVTLHLGGASLVSDTSPLSSFRSSAAAAPVIAAAALVVAGGLLLARRRRNARLSV